MISHQASRRRTGSSKACTVIYATNCSTKLFFKVRQARSILARWVDHYNTERPHSSRGYATPAAFAADLEKQRAGLNSAVASLVLPRDNNGRSLVAAE
ncbi:MAG: hypothetical protein EON55_10895 [Alphaproteobacteria bacterium]|nr:MAG: hypothetical protein EON55_10895 [Alphaproteobacteria bacterium]